MTYKNGYKVVYEIAAGGERTFYAAKSNEYPTRDADGNIKDDIVATFNDADFLGKTIYEHEGKFYVSAGRIPAYNEDGTPAEGETELDFSKVLKEEPTPAPAAATTTTEEPDMVIPEEPTEDPTEEPTEGETVAEE